MRKVSIWVGSFANEDDLNEHVEMDYDDSDEGSSPFRAESGLTWYDEDFAEGSVSEDPVATLAEHSYAETFETRAAIDLAAESGINTLYLIYDFDAIYAKARDGQLRLLGVYDYRR